MILLSLQSLPSCMLHVLNYLCSSFGTHTASGNEFRWLVISISDEFRCATAHLRLNDTFQRETTRIAQKCEPDITFLSPRREENERDAQSDEPGMFYYQNGKFAAAVDKLWFLPARYWPKVSSSSDSAKWLFVKSRRRNTKDHLIICYEITK